QHLSADQDLFMNLAERNRRAIEARDFAEAEASVQELFALVEKQAANNPSPNWNLTVQACECESNGDWQGAEAAYQAILNRSGDEAASSYKAHNDLAGFYKLLNQKEKLIEHSQLATEAARKQDLAILVLMAIREEVAVLLSFDMFGEASRLVAEASSILKSEDSRKLDVLGASIFAQRAHCNLLRGDTDAAAEDIKAAFDILEPIAPLESAGGIRSALAYTWTVEARLRAVR